MEHTIYEKTENGYILRQRNASVVALIVLILCVGGFCLIGVLAEWSQRTTQTMDPRAGGGVFAACIVASVILLRHEMGRMNIADEGIYFCRPLARTKFFAWEEIQDWGFAHASGQFTRTHVLYFSKRPLKSTRREKSKRLPLTYGKTMYICVENSDFSSLKSTGVIGFCKRHLELSSKAAKNYVPMFVCEWTELFL